MWIRSISTLVSMSLIALVVVVAVFINLPNLGTSGEPKQQEATAVNTATETIPPTTPLPSLTPSKTLLPPPTFEPPTLTPAPSHTPSATPSPTMMIDAPVPTGIHGLETPTPSSTPGCVPREDWKLRYEVKANDALDRIANLYNTTRWDLVEANCLTDANVITVGQVLRVPGDVQPQKKIECVPWELLTPYTGAYLDKPTEITFNWRGPRAPRNLLRVYRPDGSLFEAVVDLRQNETVNALEKLSAAGTYTWYVFPLDTNFKQIECKEGGPWTFYKTESVAPSAP